MSWEIHLHGSGKKSIADAKIDDCECVFLNNAENCLTHLYTDPLVVIEAQWTKMRKKCNFWEPHSF